MKNKIILLVLAFSILSLHVGTAVNTVSAATTTPAKPGTGQALEIAPPVLNLTADPGQSVKAQISLRDISSSKLLVKGQINDFTASGEDGTPKILLEEEGAEPSPYTMKTWIAPLPQLVLQPRQIKNFPITINVPKNAAPGGYYAVIRFTGTPPELEGTGVSLSASLGALVLLRVNGNAKEGMSVAELSATKNGKKGTLFESTPLTFITRLQNTGNVHETPAGQIAIKDMFGKNVATVNVNLPPRNILPQSTRKFESPLDKSVLGNKKLFGKYTANLKVTYGLNNQFSTTSSISFWVIPYKLIGGAIALLIVSFLVLRVLIKRYNKRIIKKAQKKQKRS